MITIYWGIGQIKVPTDTDRRTIFFFYNKKENRKRNSLLTLIEGWELIFDNNFDST